MSSNIPHSRPKMNEAEVKNILAGYDVSKYGPVRLLGIRGYYKKTMGNPVKNDIGIYDDAIFVVCPDGCISFNANTDPSVLKKSVAVLKPGTITEYKLGMHNMRHPYLALRQYGRVTVLRNGKEDTDTAAAPFYIDIHKGGINTTSSLGCQTIPVSQWQSFLSLVSDLLKRYKQTVVPYVLIEM